MKRFPKIEWSQIDFILLTAVVLLLIIGAAIVYSASSFKGENLIREQILNQANEAQESGDLSAYNALMQQANEMNGSTYYIRKQGFKILIGLILMLLIASVHHERWLGLSPILLFIAVCFLILLYTHMPNVIHRGVGYRWFRLFGFTFQPSDIARYALVLVLARFLHEFRDRLNNPQIYFSFLTVITAIVLLVAFERDLGTAIMITIISFTMLFVAGVKFRFLGITALSGLSLSLLFMMVNSHMEKRVVSFLGHAFAGADPSFQIKQSLISFSQGGVLGLGLGNSVQKYEFLPEAFKDMVFSIIGEEMGLFGAVGVLLLFMIIFVRGMQIAATAQNGYGKYLAVGISASIGWYAFMNAAVALGLVPATGIPMPFISYGGSALVSNLAAVGLLLNISAFCQPANKNYASERTYRARLNKMQTQGTSRTRSRASGAKY